MRAILLCGWLFLGFAVHAEAADLAALKALFQSDYYTIYQERYCGPNTAKFVKSAIANRIDLSRTMVVAVEDGFGDFGMTSGYRAREGGSLIQPRPAQPPFLSPGLSRWYHHVFLVAQETVARDRLGEVKVFDMSFENEPTVIGFSEYLDRMFQPEKSLRDLAARKKNLHYFKIQLFDAAQYAQEDRKNSGILVKEAYLRDVFPQYFQDAKTDDRHLLKTAYSSCPFLD